jgi:hypothetical protein
MGNVITKEELITKSKEFEKKSEKNLKQAWAKHREFLKIYPFREHPEEIELLTPEKIYNPGGDSFLRWIEHKLMDLAHLRVGSALYAESARDNPDRFKELLKTTANDSLSVQEKIDSHWEDIKGFGGEKTIAKKIIFCYYPDKMLPVLKTGDLEHFATQLGIDYMKKAYDSFGKSYEMLSWGQKWEHLNGLLIEYKNKEIGAKKWDNLQFNFFLYDTFPPERIPSPSKSVVPLHPLGILFEPEYEQEVVYLFSAFHRELDFPYIIKIRNEFPDAIVMDKKKDVKRIEFEVRASDFIQHKHDKKGCDFIVCWENDLEKREDLPSIISLKDFIKEL